MLALLVIAFSVAADATAVAIAASVRGLTLARGAVLALAFGAAQALMAGLGWYGGAFVDRFFSAWDHWIALGLLTIVGVKMIKEAFDPEDEKSGIVDDLRSVLVLSLATSIDALAVGASLPALGTPAPLSLVTIGAVTFVCTAAGAAFGKVLGARFGRVMEVAGGVALVLIGLNIVRSHLA